MCAKHSGQWLANLNTQGPSVIFSPRESRKVLGRMKISESDTVSQSVISWERQISSFLVSFPTLKKVIPFYFLRAGVACKVSLLGLSGYPWRSAFEVQLCPGDRASDPSISLGLKHNLEFRHFLLNWGESTALSQHADPEQRREVQSKLCRELRGPDVIYVKRSDDDHYHR